MRRAIFDAMDFWLEMGVDGLRLDAVPYLFEREGTICENLAGNPSVFERAAPPCRREDIKNRMLLAEANQWPEEAVNYFGAGDECHMAFHFPVMPRIFMSVHMEDRFPIVDILGQTPAIPDNCQWTLFLRNHDELTLEMVTDEDRDYMYKVYANDPKARINLGIRRRLAPLLGNNRRKIELLNCLLFSLPGTPVRLLRRRNRHGRQFLSRRPQRRAHADAVERRSQCRVFRSQPAAAFSADHHRPAEYTTKRSTSRRSRKT